GSAGGCVRRRARAFQDRLLVGRADEPGRPVRRGDDAAAGGNPRGAGAVLGGAGGGGGPDRGLRAGPGRDHFALTLCRIRRLFSRSQSRFFSVSRLSCCALPLASAISAFTRPPL